MAEPSSRVLIVEDDPASRSFLEIALGKRGYTTVVAEDAEVAQTRLEGPDIKTFSCVVTDYRMPGRTGLDLLDWIKKQDPSLATILVTAEGEKHLVAQSLRGGATDFLEKPVDAKMLHDAVARAIERTHQQRRMAGSDSAARELGRTQQRMLAADMTLGNDRVNGCFYPKHDAGGDFFSQFHPAPHQLFCLLTDVSGHDLQAAYISAYFQGIVRGLLMKGAPIQEIFCEFNRFLLEEWNAVKGPLRMDRGIEDSVAACALLFDFSTRTATVFTHGTPAPVAFTPAGETRVIGETGGSPLGWFPQFSPRGTHRLIAEETSFYLWTDGLEILAEKRGISTLSLAYALLEARRLGKRPAWIDDAPDDILLAELNLAATRIPEQLYRPLICEEYRGDQAGEIDQFQAFWRRSLCEALPELPPARLYDILLASREILLNALIHGCRGRNDQKAIFQLAVNAHARRMSVRVSDPGPGYTFDLRQHERIAACEPVEEHWGLIFATHLADDVDFQRQGASVAMHFNWEYPQP